MLSMIAVHASWRILVVKFYFSGNAFKRRRERDRKQHDNAHSNELIMNGANALPHTRSTLCNCLFSYVQSLFYAYNIDIEVLSGQPYAHTRILVYKSASFWPFLYHVLIIRLSAIFIAIPSLHPSYLRYLADAALTLCHLLSSLHSFSFYWCLFFEFTFDLCFLLLLFYFFTDRWCVLRFGADRCLLNWKRKCT